MTLEAVEKNGAFEPNEPAPQQDQEYCEGKIMMPCCCPQLHTRTQILNIGPQTIQQLQQLLQQTVSNYEAQGYLVLAHSIMDAGAGWKLGLTIGWYA